MTEKRAERPGGFFRAVGALLAGFQKLVLVYLIGSLVYLLVLGPTSLVFRLLRIPGLDIRRERRASYWATRRDPPPTLERLRRQF